MRIAAAGAVVVASASLLALPAGASAVGRHLAGQPHCKNDGRKYIHAQVVVSHGSTATVTGGALRFHPCGEDDGYFTRTHHRITLTLTSSTTITVFKKSNNPSTTKTVTAANFATAYSHRADEPYYTFTGAHSDVTKITEFFRP